MSITMDEYTKKLWYQYQIGLFEKKKYTIEQATRALDKQGIYLPIISGVEEKPKNNKKKKNKESSKTFLPKDFQQYIGQDRVKSILDSYIQATIKRKTQFPHLLIHGKPGMGKTTLANILANRLHTQLKEMIGSTIKTDLVEVVKNLKGKMLFIDEVHAVSRDIVETIYTPMERFTDNGKPIPEFTLLGATTEIGEIIKDRKPFYDRFKIIVELEDYTISNLGEIGKQYKTKMFPKDKIDDKLYRLVAENSRYTPRTMIRLTEALVYFNGNLTTVLRNFGIIKNGYTIKDKKLLGYLAKCNVVGLQGLAAFLETSTINYQYEIEPYLIKNEVIIRTPRGRAISEKGRVVLKSLS